MGYTINNVMHNWLMQTGKVRNSSSVFYEGDTIYSYGHHFPMAIHIRSKKGRRWILYNTDSYSVTTGQHQNELLWIIKNNSNKKVVQVPFRALQKLGVSLRAIEFVDEAINPAYYGIIHNIFMSNCSLLMCNNSKNKYLITYDYEIWDRHVVIQVGKKHKTVESAILSLFPKEIIRYVKGLTDLENHHRRLDVLTIGSLFLLLVSKKANKNRSKSILYFESYDGTEYQAGNVLEIGNDVYVSGWIKNGEVNRSTDNVISSRRKLILGDNLYKIIESKGITQGCY